MSVHLYSYVHTMYYIHDQHHYLSYSLLLKNEDVTTALQNYTADSVRSLKTGENNPCIKDYLNVKADSFEPGEYR